MSVAVRNRPSIVCRAAIERGFDAAIRRNLAHVARQQVADSEKDPDAFRDFAQQVAMATAGPCLRYSQRLKLIALAGRGGIDRFDANLIIAAIEHRVAKERPRAVTQSSPHRVISRAVVLSIALALQLFIVIGGWLVLR